MTTISLSVGEVKADGISYGNGKRNRRGSFHKILKKQKHSIERRRAKKDPEAPNAYKRYRGYET